MIYIDNPSTNPYFNHAIEEYLMKNLDEDIFMLWRNEPTILIGRNQNTYSEIDLDYVNEQGIHVVRRLSGGGAIYCDLANMQYSFITKKGSSSEDHSFAAFAQPVVNALHDLGVDAKFTGRNDIVVNDKKISGNAQFHYKNYLLHHGTVLFDINMEVLSKALKPKPAKFTGKAVKSVVSRVGVVKEFIDMDVLEFMDYLKKSIMRQNHIRHEYRLTTRDYKGIDAIQKNRFETWQWNFGESPRFNFENIIKYPFGLVEYKLSIENGKIKDIHIFGDYFGEENIGELEATLIDLRHDRQAIMDKLRNFPVEKYIQGMTSEVLADGLTAMD